MIILAIDTSQGNCKLAISNKNKILAEINEQNNANQVENLLPLLNELLTQANIKFSEVNYLAVTKGPGSFTGIRIGLAAALGLTIHNNIKIVTLTNLEVLASLANEKTFYKIAVINALRKQVYTQVFNNNLDDITSPKAINITELSKFLSIYNSHTSEIIIDNKDLKLESLKVHFKNYYAGDVLNLAYKKIIANQYSSDLSALYIRPADAIAPKPLFNI